MKRVLVTEPIHAAGLALFEARPDIEVLQLNDVSPQTLAAAMPGIHAIAVRTAHLPADILARANDLKIVSRHGVGCDRVAVGHLSGRGIPVAIAAGANAGSVSEHTLALMLSLARRLAGQHVLVKNGRWAERQAFLARDLHGATVLIVGFGRIGRRVAPLCKAFGMDVVVADIALDEELARSMGCRGVSDFRPELPGADFITLHVPLDASTHHLIGRDEFAAMKDGAILINCARGRVVDDTALLAALDTGKLAGAGLDVFPEEPPAAGCPLFGRPDVVLTPHNAAASHLSVRESSRMTAQNILDYFDGRLREDCIFNLDALAGHKAQGART